MSAESDPAQQLAEARAALAKATASPEDGQAKPVTAASANGLVSVTLGVDGRVSAINVEPKAVKEGTDYIAEHVLTALNDALDQRSAMVGSDERVPDLQAIGESLAEVQDAGVRQLQAMSASIGQVLGKLNKSA
ncbi:YbaB/EbfC family nucleoid-associated protein [Glycomyces sp. NRRL B-16210]|uniref:YbaB/EbfC family nucleoid-associated protein n=1 Tax=Glycomyces sp. NRRL B-16210 TaxID=1463821 RepID=UPI0004BEB521|nr:YbaB/EbfC family nucleoid-associated protein [Glycomyces sp. NRRL B-16210]